MKTTTSVWRAFGWLSVVGATLSLCYLGLRTSPDVQTIPWIPRVVGQFLARNDFLANLLGFMGLTLVVQAAGSGWSRPAAARLGARVGLLAALVVGLECAQIFLPRRSLDVEDIFAGLSGVAVASCPWLFAPVKSGINRE